MNTLYSSLPDNIISDSAMNTLHHIATVMHHSAHEEPKGCIAHTSQNKCDLCMHRYIHTYVRLYQNYREREMVLCMLGSTLTQFIT